MAQPSTIRLRAVLTLLLVAFLWSLGGMLIKSIDWPPMAIAGGRSGVAALVLLLAYPVRTRRFFHTRFSTTELLGALAYAATVSTFVIATKLTTAANAILLQYTAPIYVAAFGAWFLGERATRFDWAMIGITVLGMGVFFLEDLSADGYTGNIIAVVSGVAFAGVFITFRKLREGSTHRILVTGNLLTLAVALPALGGMSLDSSDLPLLIVLGIFQLGLPYVLYSWAIRHVRALDAVMIMVIEPLLNPLWVLAAHGERPGWYAVIGGAIVLTAVTIRAVALVHRSRVGSAAAAGGAAVEPVRS